MLSNRYVSALACIVLAASGGVSRAQSGEPRDAWLMKNYRFTGPPAPGSIPAVDPLVSELRQIQNTLLSIMRKADFWGDYEAALAFAQQATVTAQLIDTLNERQESAVAAQTTTGEATSPAASGPLYLIALKNGSIEAATKYWMDGPMLNYTTRQGTHVQVRLDIVDRGLTITLNRSRNLEFNLPQ